MTEDLLGDLTEAPTKDGPTQDFEIEKKYLERALSATAGCVSGKDIQPILNNYQFTVIGNYLRVTTSNAMLSAIVKIPVQSTAHEGSAVWPASLLQSVIRETSTETIALRATSKKNKHVGKVKAGTASWTLPLMQPEGFPYFDLETDFHDLERVPFLDSLRRVSKAVSQDSTKPHLMLVDCRNNKMRASDGVRLQQVKCLFPFDAQLPSQILPELMRRLVSSKLEKVQVGQNERALYFKFGLLTLVAQKVSAQFPNVDEVLLKPALENDQTLLCNRKNLEFAIRKVRLTADETSAVVLSLNPGSVTVETKDNRGAVAVESIEAEWAYPARHVAFNHKHLTDLLSSVTCEDACLKFGKDLKSRPSPMLLEDTDFLAVLSQIRVMDWS